MFRIAARTADQRGRGWCQQSGSGRRWLWIAGVAGIALGHVASAQDAADLPDKVIITPGGRASTRVTLHGEVLEFNGEVLRIRLKAGEAPREYPAGDVVEVATPQATAHQQGLELFRKGDFAAAEKEFRRAFEDEPRAWVKRELLSRLIRCQLRQGDYLNASNGFVILLKSDPATPFFPLIPLQWGPAPPNAAIKQVAEGWLLDEKQLPAAKLLGASLLLDDPSMAATAQLALRNLSTHTDRRVRVLAMCQQWRARLATGKEINPTELKIWDQRLESVPEELAAGPHYLLGRAFASRREYELAAFHLLWTPLVQSDDHYFAARAQLEAAEALEQIGQLESAARLYQETTERFADTPAATQAKSQLDQLLKQATLNKQ